MTDTTIAHDFIDIALGELENENLESAAEFVEDAAEIIESAEQLSHVHGQLTDTLEYIEAEETSEAYETLKDSWIELSEQ